MAVCVCLGARGAGACGLWGLGLQHHPHARAWALPRLPSLRLCLELCAGRAQHQDTHPATPRLALLNPGFAPTPCPPAAHPPVPPPPPKQWYRVDFGNNKSEVLRFVQAFLAPPAQAQLAAMLADGQDIKVVYKEYDWSLNGTDDE